MDLAQVSSLVGAALLLTAFAASSFKKIALESLVYHILNFFGALLLAISAALSTNYGFLILNGVWTCVSAAALIRLTFKRQM